ncbi:hypothetical protein HDV00_004947 [Rhizophlyctis rosea]|nr:hypothetical protein HDV00_004947 [Rhizophlyctis rosea]
MAQQLPEEEGGGVRIIALDHNFSASAKSEPFKVIENANRKNLIVRRLSDQRQIASLSIRDPEDIYVKTTRLNIFLGIGGECWVFDMNLIRLYTIPSLDLSDDIHD